MSVSLRQQQCLRALGRGAMSTVGVAQALDTTPGAAGKVLHALYRRSLVTVTETGRWCATERGRRKVAA